VLKKRTDNIQHKNTWQPHLIRLDPERSKVRRRKLPLLLPDVRLLLQRP
jgi:hypothetical protein